MKAPWRDRSVPLVKRRGPTALVTALCVSLGSACTFAPGGAPGNAGDDDDDDDGTRVDGGPPDAGPPLPCDEPIHAEFTINGMPAVGGGPPIATVLIGDTVRLDATGSCSQRGTVRYLWAFSGGELLESASPGEHSQMLTVYPGLPGDFNITLTVSDDVGSADPVTVAIRSIGWAEIGTAVDVRDLAVGGGAIWIATNLGPRFIDLANVSAGLRDVNEDIRGEPIPADLSAVAFSPVTGQVWFGSGEQVGAIWRVSITSLSAPFTVAQVSLPTALGSARVRDISPQGQGVSIATDGGVAVSPVGGPFDAPIFTGSFHAVAENQAGGWAGSDDGVFRLAMAKLPPLEPFPGNQKIRALAGDANNLWVGSDGNGVARIGSDDMADVFNPANTQQGLPSERVRAIAIDDARDAWAATQNGVGRYKRDLAKWVAMQGEAGIRGNDLRAVAALREERVYVVASGGGGGVISILRFPP